jgi:hypothetical protein
MIVVTFTAPADKRGERPYVYGPFSSPQEAHKWIDENRKEFPGSYQHTRLLPPIEER